MRVNTHPGRFIVLEGLDGSGQTTQVQRLGQFLEQAGVRVAATKEPTKESAAGKEIRSILKGEREADPQKFQDLFAKDRQLHLKNVVIPALSVGTWVVSDRYVFTSLAYGTAAGVDIGWLLERNSGILKPDIAFFLSVRPETCLERIRKRGEPAEYFEKQEALEKNGRAFQNIAERFSLEVVDGEGSPDEVAAEIQGRVSRAFSL